MFTDVAVIYEGGVLRPAAPLPLAEGQRLSILVPLPSATLVPEETDPAWRRVAEATTLDEWIEAANAAGADRPDPTFEPFYENINETRRQAGARLLYPPELKGDTW